MSTLYYLYTFFKFDPQYSKGPQSQTTDMHSMLCFT